jgi:guanosine-3',5'-bis(diphosphate) 3'-pyrophosphohydrolase
VDYTVYARAVVFACEQHRGQKRTEAGGEVDYVVHPIRVAEHVRHIAKSDDPEILCAAVLHDTIEDSGTRYDEIAEAFGDRVASIVAELTNDSRLPKAARHEDMIRRAATISLEAKLIKLADRYDNVCSMTVSDAGKRRRLIEETPHLLTALRGACPNLEDAIVERLRAIGSV